MRTVLPRAVTMCNGRSLTVWAALLFLPWRGWGAIDFVLENDAYQVKQLTTGVAVVTEKSLGASANFSPEFTVFYSADDPQLSSGHGNKALIEKPLGTVVEFNYSIAAWNDNNDFFQAPGDQVTVTAGSYVRNGDTVEWVFPAQAGFQLSGQLELPAGTAEPEVTYTLVPTANGWYSVGYTGVVQKPFSSLNWHWQPLIWQGKRVPLKSYLTLEFQCPVPAVLMNNNGTTIGLCVDVDEIPFRQPLWANSEFGVVLRNSAGAAEPMIFAPVYGGTGSYMAAGGTFDFTVNLIVRGGDWYENYTHIARNLMGFEDYRQNSLGSLNDTLDNLVDYIMNSSGENYSYWYPDQKAYGYQQDKPGYGRQQSAADAVSLAMVRDHRAIYEQRALPTIEYMASRGSNMIKLDGSIPYMDGPGNSTEDWAALYLMSGGRTAVFRNLAERKAVSNLLAKVNPSTSYSRLDALTNAKSYLRQLIAMYQVTGENEYLDDARKVADDYIYWRLDQEPVDFHDMRSSFWIEIGPIWDALEELYSVTGEATYLDATIAGLRERTAFNYLQPRVPDDNVTVNGETVPAWRVSANGLNTEAAGTAHSHRGIFMAPYASPMMRMAHHDNDALLRDIARSAVIGRWANYPGYTLRMGHTTIFEKPDYPLQDYSEYSNTAHFNHPLPMSVFIIDYLVSDVFYRSAGAIEFPACYTSTGAYFRNKVYGDRPGRFYDEENVWLWLPKALLSIDDVQLNYVGGYGNGKVYMVLTNQSDQPVTATISLNATRMHYQTTHTARRWQENVLVGDISVTNGQFTIAVAGKGITALALDGLDVETELQQHYVGASPETLSDASYEETLCSYGKVSGMIFSFGRGITSAYVWLEADSSQLQQATLHYSAGGVWQQISDDEYPFEFTVGLEADTSQFQSYIEGMKPDSTTEDSATLTLDVFDSIGGKTLAGQVLNLQGNPISGAQVVCGNTHLDFTDGQGQFELTGFTSGDKVLDITKDGFFFLPEKQVVTVRDGDLSQVDWIGKAGEFVPFDLIIVMAQRWLDDTRYQWYEQTVCDLFSPADWNQDCAVDLADWAQSGRQCCMIAPGSLIATASSESTQWGDRFASYAVDGSGMTGASHSAAGANGHMWMSYGNALPQWFKVNLGGSYDLSVMRIWNLNWTNYTERGCRDIEVYTCNSIDDPGNPIDQVGDWDFLGNHVLTEAPGTNDYGSTSAVQPDDIELDGITARWIAIKVASNYAPTGTGYSGLSEIRFWGSAAKL